MNILLDYCHRSVDYTKPHLTITLKFQKLSYKAKILAMTSECFSFCFKSKDDCDNTARRSWSLISELMHTLNYFSFKKYLGLTDFFLVIKAVLCLIFRGSFQYILYLFPKICRFNYSNVAPLLLLYPKKNLIWSTSKQITVTFKSF